MILEKTFEYKTENNFFCINSFIKFISSSKIKKDYNGFSALCQTGCKNFGKKYSCPPKSPSFEILSRDYKYLVVNAFKIPYTELKKEYNSVRMANVVSKSLQRKIFDITAQELKGKNYRFLILENGSCRLCKVCNLQKNEPCKYPDKMRFSLEATGVDVNDLVLKCYGFLLQWYYKGKKDKFPEYQCVVSAILTNEPNEVSFILNKNIADLLNK